MRLLSEYGSFEKVSYGGRVLRNASAMTPERRPVIFKDVRFYPILNFGLFWAAFLKISVFYSTRFSSILGRPHFFSRLKHFSGQRRGPKC